MILIITFVNLLFTTSLAVNVFVFHYISPIDGQSTVANETKRCRVKPDDGTVLNCHWETSSSLELLNASSYAQRSRSTTGYISIHLGLLNLQTSRRNLELLTDFLSSYDALMIETLEAFDRNRRAVTAMKKVIKRNTDVPAGIPIGTHFDHSTHFLNEFISQGHRQLIRKHQCVELMKKPALTATNSCLLFHILN